MLSYLCTPKRRGSINREARMGIKFIKINIFFLVKIWELKKGSYLCTPIKTEGSEEEEIKRTGNSDELTLEWDKVH
jgi:hypothetical protein